MDPFKTMGMGFVTRNDSFSQTSQRRFSARGLTLSFNYTFGQQPRVRQREREQPEGAPQGGDGQ